MPWDFDTSVPVYLQIAETVRRRIVSGEYERGSQLPSVGDLAVEAAVNPNTVQRAFMCLENDGLIETRGTMGRYVTDSLESVEAARETLAQDTIGAFCRRMEALGYTGEDTIELLKKTYEGETK